MKIFLDTIGCRLNQSEIESYANQFRHLGHTVQPDPHDADLAVVNTCAVTSAAVSDSRQRIRQLQRLGVKDIITTGCWSSLFPDDVLILDRISRNIPNVQKDQLVSILFPSNNLDHNLEPILRQPIPGARFRTRAFLKVQDGCDNHCTFCITRLARGYGRSRLIEEIHHDIRFLLQPPDSPNTIKEIVLTGVHLGSWGQDLNPPNQLKDLIKSILDSFEFQRIRLSSLEPWDLDPKFFDLWKDPRLCRHLHLPLQSGSAATLKRMARKTTPQTFSDLVTIARSAIPDVAITTDLIAGFPGETDYEFEESNRFIHEMNFAGGHVFTYSPRPGTAAMHMPDQIPFEIRKARNAYLRGLLEKSAYAYQSRFTGKTMLVLWESTTAMETEMWHLSGLTDNYLRVHARAPHHLWNQITPVQITGQTEKGLEGQFVTN